MCLTLTGCKKKSCQECLFFKIDAPPSLFFILEFEHKIDIPYMYIKKNCFSCLDHTFPDHLFYQLYMQETGNLNITGLVQ